MMRYLVCMLLTFFSVPLYASEPIHHDLVVTLSPQEHRLTVVDTISLPESARREMLFTLHRGLNPISSTARVGITKRGEHHDMPLFDTYKVLLPPGLTTFTIAYEGAIHHPLEQNRMTRARGFSDTDGSISEDGVYLSGSSGWYPDFSADFVTFTLEVNLPASWDCVSQGARSLHDRSARSTSVRWNSPEPQESIYLMAARFATYEKTSGSLQAMIFLRSPDKTLADKYLDATIRYIKMYGKLIGPYPYKKFALVENFRETGFGMPSFTLLGPTVIRLPFIIDSSYPHEILHNWWGNSVYPVYEKGNWSEGLTAYLADYLIKEQQGGGAEYRVATLQKYADYVRGSKDFPLTHFRSRHSQSSEAIGYGKSLMFFHMLRRDLGDDIFRKGLREFYHTYKFSFAGFDDIRSSFEKASNRDLKQVFDQWVTRAGAPQLKLGAADIRSSGKMYQLTATLEQTQEGMAYSLNVPIVVTLEGQEQAYQTTVEMDRKNVALKLLLPYRPLRLDIDPEFELFRRLGRDEIPPALSLALGAKKMLILLPAEADKTLLQAYRTFAQALSQSGPDEVEIKMDRAVAELPDDRAITVIGWENRFTRKAIESLSAYGVALKETSVEFNRETVGRKNHSFAFVARHPRNFDLALSLIAADLPDSVPGLATKLPHYGKYSYLAFKGPEPMNIAKGRWVVESSSLTTFLPSGNGVIGRTKMGRLANRAPLAISE